MIYKRVAARLRAQDWVAITIELGIVILGVFLGTWVANWNQERAERREVKQLVGQLQSDVDRWLERSDEVRDYYATTGRFADVALARWAGATEISDREFVIAAYQASQVVALTIDRQTYTMLLGSDQVRQIGDVPLRTAIIQMLNFNFEPVSLSAVRSSYRDNVRQILPETIQKEVRARCGDTTNSVGAGTIPARCDIALSPADAAHGARELLAHPELVGELRLHQALVATFLFNLGRLEGRLKTVASSIER